MEEQLRSPSALCLFFNISQLLEFLFVLCAHLNGFEKSKNNYLQHTELELDTNIKQRGIKQSLVANPHGLKLFGVVLEICL